jgi:integrase
MGKLTAKQVLKAKPGKGPDGKVKAARLSDGDGLQLFVKPTGAMAWVLRVQVDGKSRDIGLGAVDLDRLDGKDFGGADPLADVSLMMRKSLTLEEARKKARALRELAKAGANPIAERDRERIKVPSFKEAAIDAHKALQSGWGAKTAKAFMASLEDHAFPKLGAMKVNAIGGADIITTLAPIWTDKPVMARKIRTRIGQVLAFAKARGWRTDALPDVRELRSGLSKQARGGNLAAMPFPEVPAFVAAELGKGSTASRFAMLFVVLTAARSGEVRQATWEQVDIDAATWTRPADVMKMREGHVVTLSAAAVALLVQFQPDKAFRKGLIFPGAKGKALSDMSLTKSMRAAGRTETIHGFRSAFRDFAAERMPTIPAMVAEMALAHKVGTATEQAYLRSDLRDMRRALMDAWGQFVAPALSGGAADNVVSIGAASKLAG